MAETLTLAVGALALLVFVLLGVVIELFRDVRQLREVNGILDRPLDVDVEEVAGEKPSRYGLPIALDSAASAIVLFLSDRCATCHALATGLSSEWPQALWVVLEARSPQSAQEFLTKFHFTAETTHGRLIVDRAGAIAEGIGLRTTPVGFRVENGVFKNATTVPSKRYLSSIMPGRVRLERGASSPQRERALV